MDHLERRRIVNNQQYSSNGGLYDHGIPKVKSPFCFGALLAVCVLLLPVQDAKSELTLEENDDKCLQMYHEEKLFNVGWYCTSALKRGGAKAQYVMGMVSRSKDRDGKKNKKALALFEQSAAQGFAPALTAIGRLYQTAQGVDRNMCKAEALFGEALNAGDLAASTLLGYSLFNGYCVGEMDSASALPYLELCAADDPVSRVMVGAAIMMTGDFVDGRAWLVQVDSSTPLPQRMKQMITAAEKVMSAEELVASDARLVELNEELEAKSGACRIIDPMPMDVFD